MSNEPHPIKIVVSGPVGAGKTTYVSALSETEVISTDEAATESIGKAMTTVAMDYGTLFLDGTPIYLFGTPGQDRFDFMWEILCEGAFGLILLVAGDRPGDFAKARAILDFITSQIPIPFIVGVTRQDLDRVWEPEDVADFFDIPEHLVRGLDARERDESMILLYRLFQVIHTAKEQETSFITS